jgi:hypothetical protein
MTKRLTTYRDKPPVVFIPSRSLPLLFVCLRYLPDADNLTIDAFHRLVSGLSNVNFGDFDMIGKYFGNNTEDAERLDGLNVTFLMLQVGKPCDCLCGAELKGLQVGKPCDCLYTTELERLNVGKPCDSLYTTELVRLKVGKPCDSLYTTELEGLQVGKPCDCLYTTELERLKVGKPFDSVYD